VFIVMPALVAGIHVLLAATQQESVDGRDKPGHDEWEKWFNMTGIRP
jgi:D-alanyl-D-alanine dipeptidase